MLIAVCPRCAWKGSPEEIVEIDDDPIVRCCPRCACEHVAVETDIPSMLEDLRARAARFA